MKMKMKYLFSIVLGTTTILMLNSCLKKRETTLDGDGPRNVVEFKNSGSNVAAGTSFYPLFQKDLGTMNPGESKSFNVNVNYAGADVAPSDISVELEVDQTALDRFNDENGTDFIIPPSSVCSYPTSFVIKKGQRVSTDSAKVTLSADFDFNASYALPLRIKSVSPSHTISANFGAAMFGFILRNQYDGVYRYQTSDITSLIPDQDAEVELQTAGANRLILKPGLLGYYSNEVYYNIDPNTNQITVECPSLGVQTPQDTRSLYDPATKVLKVYWKQGNGGRTFEETLTYIGPRD